MCLYNTPYSNTDISMRTTMKPIPTNTVVHTPTEAEAKELLAILHENGYSVTTSIKEMKMVNSYIDEDICFNINDETWGHCTREWYKKKGYTILTLTKFKERYCEEEKPRLKFEVGDLAIFPNRDKPMRIDDIEDGVGMSWWDDGCIRAAACLEDLTPYTEPETKPTEDMETKVNHNLSQNSAEKCNNNNAISTDEKKELNLCELLKGHEGETIFLTTMGTVIFHGVSEQSIQFKTHKTAKDTYLLKASGKMSENGVVIAYPSRALYEQYPLDPYTAWMKWQEEQRKPFIYIHWGEVDCNGDEEEDYTGNTYFRTPADRDKCIEEIKAIINKYSK